MLQNGLYEQIISRGLEKEISDSDQLVQTAAIDTEEAAKVLSKYIAEVMERQLLQLKDNGGNLNDQIGLANRVIEAISHSDAGEDKSVSVAERAEQLLAVLDCQNNIQAINGKAELVRPVTSIAQTSLFTGAVHEP